MDEPGYSKEWRAIFGDLDGRWTRRDDFLLILLLIDEWVKGTWIVGGNNNRQAIENVYRILCYTYGPLLPLTISFIWRKVEEFKTRYWTFRYLLGHPETVLDDNTGNVRGQTKAVWNKIVQDIPIAAAYRNYSEPYYNQMKTLFYTEAERDTWWAAHLQNCG